jgi:tripartite-type tricarboxylate transporter receptor subunit TctC
MSIKRFRVMTGARAIAAAAALVAATSTAAPQDWPTRPMTMVVPFAAGGPMDTIGRILALRLSEVLRQQVVVENVGGAGGMTGAARVAKAAPDGYQFVLGNLGTHAASQTFYKNPLYNAAADFSPVGLIAEVPFVLVTRKDLPAANLPEFAAHAKANQANMQYGSGGSGSATHLACVLLNTALGIAVTHVPYRGGGPAMQDLIAGRIDYQCLDTSLAIPQIESGAIKGIAILSRERSPVLPSLASVHEQGIRDFDATNWSALFLPKGAPGAVVQRLHQAMTATIETPGVQERLKELGGTVVAAGRRSPDYLQTFVAAEVAKWAAPIKASGAAVE